jgi:two-component system, NarL family, sensor kinase
MQNWEIIYSVLVAITIVSLLVCFIIYILFNYKKYHNKFVTKIETINASYEKELLATQLEIQEQTFIHIAQELHDNVGHIISLANLSMSKLIYNNDKEVKDNVQSTMQLLERSLEEIRHISRSLNADFIKNTGLINAVTNELQQLEKLGCCSTTFTASGKSCSISHEKEIVLFRIIQEALNNIIKHSKARKVHITIHFGDKNLHLGINDNGIGFSVEDQLKLCRLNKSSGLQNIIRRSKIINASYSIVSNEKDGTTITIKTPY